MNGGESNRPKVLTENVHSLQGTSPAVGWLQIIISIISRYKTFNSESVNSCQLKNNNKKHKKNIKYFVVWIKLFLFVSDNVVIT